MTVTSQPMKTQGGNALFLILLAVLLFAALSFAITRSNTGVLESQQESLDAEYAQDASILSLAATEFTRVTMRGCSLSDIPGQSTMGASANANCNFFSSQGGSFPYATDGVPHVQLNKAAVPGVGTDTDDVLGIIILPDVNHSKSLCDRVNLKNSTAYTIDPSATFLSATWGNFTDSDKNNPSAWPTEFSGKAQGCLFDATIGSYVMYDVLQER